MSTLFISYSTKDRATAEVVYAKLIEMGYERPFRDDHPDSGIPAGSAWEQELYRKLRLCRALIVLVSRNWLDSKWCFAELAYAKAMGKEFFPVLIDDSPNVPSVVTERQSIRFSNGDIWQRLQRGLVEADLAPENEFPWPVEGFDECPYPGLGSFEPHHAGIYFGRDEEILQLRERLNQMTGKGEPRLLYVVGASGSGKSSLVKAGLLPRLTRKEYNRWCVLPIFRWNELRAKGRDWPEQLAISLRGAWPSDSDTRPDWRAIREHLLVATLAKEQQKDEIEVANYEAAIAKAADRLIDDTKDLLDARNEPNATPLLVIDQFEELLTATNDVCVTTFLDFLGSVLSSSRSPWRCIATVRSDFLAAIQTNAQLIEWKSHTDLYPLHLMTPDRFYDVIRYPAAKVGIDFESDALVDRIVKDTGTNDALPLLAFALQQLYKQSGQTRKFTEKSYEAIGGIEGCLAKVANESLNEVVLSDAVPAEQCERKLHLVFSNHLVRINDQDQFVRRPAVWSDLPDQARPLLLRFINQRLITSRPRTESDPDSERVIEVAHEALFRRWDKLGHWLDERRDLLRWRADVERSRAADGKMWKGLTSRQLAIARDWPQQRGDELLEYEKDWISSASRKARNRRLALVAATFLFALLAIAAVFFAVQARDNYQRARAAVDNTLELFEANFAGRLSEQLKQKELLSYVQTYYEKYPDRVSPEERAQVQYHLGWIYELLGRSGEARKYYDEAERHLGSGNASILLSKIATARARVAFAFGDIDLALREFTRAYDYRKTLFDSARPAEKAERQRLLANSIMHLAIIETKMENYPRAEELWAELAAVGSTGLGEAQKRFNVAIGYRKLLEDKATTIRDLQEQYKELAKKLEAKDVQGAALSSRIEQKKSEIDEAWRRLNDSYVRAYLEFSSGARELAETSSQEYGSMARLKLLVELCRLGAQLNHEAVGYPPPELSRQLGSLVNAKLCYEIAHCVASELAIKNPENRDLLLLHGITQRDAGMLQIELSKAMRFSLDNQTPESSAVAAWLVDTQDDDINEARRRLQVAFKDGLNQIGAAEATLKILAVENPKSIQIKEQCEETEEMIKKYQYEEQLPSP